MRCEVRVRGSGSRNERERGAIGARVVDGPRLLQLFFFKDFFRGVRGAFTVMGPANHRSAGLELRCVFLSRRALPSCVHYSDGRLGPARSPFS